MKVYPKHTHSCKPPPQPLPIKEENNNFLHNQYSPKVAVIGNNLKLKNSNSYSYKILYKN
jgi:hypothetical protein